MAKKNYTPIEELVSKLNSQIEELKAGSLSASEIAGLVKSSREAYERLVILEFQFHEKANKPEPIPAEIEEPLNQTSLIDVIEEVQAEKQELEVKPPEPEPVQEELFVFDEIEKIEVQEEEKETLMPEPEVAAPEEPLEDLETEPEEVSIEPEVSKSKAPEPTPQETDSSESVAEKFESAPIADLKSAISLNKKFQYIRVLTGNNSENFNALVEKLNSLSSKSDAMMLFTKTISAPDDEDDKKVYEGFVELLERRFS